MEKLTGSQRKYLRGLAHGKKPVVFIGQKKLDGNVIKAINEALDHHELIKIKCIDFKEKSQKKLIAQEIEKQTGAELVGIIGHVLILFRAQPDEKNRKISVPTSSGA